MNASQDPASLLADLTAEFASSLNIEETLQNAIDQIIDYLHAEAASIFLIEGDVIVCRKCAGPVDVTGLELALDQGIVGQTVSENTPQIVRDVRNNPSFADSVDKDTGFVTRSLLCVPLKVREQCIGVLELINKRSGDRLFSDNDMHLATAVASAAALAIHNASMAQALVEQERVRKELELARQIQLSLLPPVPPPDFPVRGLNIPAREVSGDFYDFVPVSDDKIYFSVADVSGKGMNAALLMAKTTSLLRCLAKDEPAAGDLLYRVNEEICETASMGMFVTIVAGYIDLKQGLLEFSNAGHQPPLARHGNGEFEELPASSPPLGIEPGLEFETTTLSLSSTQFYIFTDGLTECADENGELLGVEGLTVVINDVGSQPAAERLASIVDSLRSERRVFHDDITIILIDQERT